MIKKNVGVSGKKSRATDVKMVVRDLILFIRQWIEEFIVLGGRVRMEMYVRRV